MLLTVTDGDIVGQAGERARQAGAVEGVRRGVPRGQMAGVEVPALVQAVLERARDEPVVVAPGGVHVVGVAHRQHVGRSVGEPDAGAGRGCLHDQLGVVGDGMLQRLLLGGDPAERGVVVGAVVQRGQPAAGRVDHPSDEGRAIRAEHGLRRLHLDLEADRLVRQPQLVLDGRRRVQERRDLLGAGHLRQRDHEGVESTSRLGQRGHEVGQRPEAAGPRRLLEGLDPDAGERRGALALLGLRERMRRLADVVVLLALVVTEIPVLEVDTQVLDGLVRELRLDAADDLGVGDHGGELVGVLVEQRQRLLTPLRRGVGGVAVGGHVRRVHRLPSRALARVARHQGRVRLRQPLVEVVGQAGGELVGGDHALTLGRWIRPRWSRKSR